MAARNAAMASSVWSVCVKTKPRLLCASAYSGSSWIALRKVSATCCGSAPGLAHQPAQHVIGGRVFGSTGQSGSQGLDWEVKIRYRSGFRREVQGSLEHPRAASPAPHPRKPALGRYTAPGVRDSKRWHVEGSA